MNTDSRQIDSDWLAAVVHDCIMHGAQRWQIDAAIAKAAADQQRPAPTREAVDAAYALCVERWIDDAGANQDEIHAYHIALRKHLLYKAEQINDYPTAARIAQDLAKLQDQYVSQRQAPARQAANAERVARLRNRKPRLRAVR
jgi:hypothetical protein